MDGTNALGEFLRARRGQVRPQDVGLPGSGLRRVPGLRREEVAMLSGISSDYYLRLEQGRDRNPSAQVLRAIAKVLRLDADATSYLLSLTRDRPRDARPGARTGPARPPQEVPAGLLRLIDGWPRNPAYIQNRYTDCLAANTLATALTPSYRPGVNLLRSSSTPRNARCAGTGTSSPRRASPRCGRTRAPSPTTPGCATWSATSRCAARGSARSGPGTRCGPGAAG